MNRPQVFERISYYAITTYYLKPVQIASRFRNLLYTKVLHRFKWYRASFLRCATGDEPYSIVQFPTIRPANVDLTEIEQGIFTFLNRQVQLGVPTDWTPPDESRLWIYNLHYFDYLRAIARRHQQAPSQTNYELFRRLTSEWMQQCPVATSLVWDSYPISLRLCNWSRAYMVFETELNADVEFSRQLRKWMYMQTVFLEKHLEYHILNNHLLENGRALWLMGRFFIGAEPDRWEKKGYAILLDGLKVNVLDDGAHDEISPMYHQIMLEMYQEMADVMLYSDGAAPDLLLNRINAMENWLGEMLHPDGNLSLFNDCAFEIAGEPSEFVKDTFDPSDGLTALSESGYYIFRNKSKNNYLVFDAGSMGPDHINGHGHCDALSFELSIGGNRILVDSGVSDYYGDIRWRDYYRSTRAHNTVVIDDQEQSEIWDRFRIARRYQIQDITVAQDDMLSYVGATHTGYQRLADRVNHRRWLCQVDNRFWIVCDFLDGSSTHSTESLLHFHPDVEISEPPTATDYGLVGNVLRDDSILQVMSFGVDNAVQYKGDETPRVQGWYAPQFGIRIENPVWGFKRVGALPVWSGHLLWPEKGAVNLQVNSFNDGIRLQVQAADRHYEIMINPSNVDLKIQ